MFIKISLIANRQELTLNTVGNSNILNNDPAQSDGAQMVLRYVLVININHHTKRQVNICKTDKSYRHFYVFDSPNFIN